MLSRLVWRGVTANKTAFKPQVAKMIAGQYPVRYFRPGTVNPYKVDPVELSDAERKEQESRPVWDRVFDHKKYMHHEGPLKVRTRYRNLD